MAMNGQDQGGASARRSRREPGVDMTPMIDCVFLLIIFFMLATTFSPLPGIKVKLPPPSPNTNQTPPKNFALKIDNPVSGQMMGVMTLNTGIVDMAELGGRFMNGTEEQKEQLVIRSDRQVRHEQIVMVMDKAKLAGITKIGFAMVAGEY